MSNNPLLKVAELGQSIWLDYIRRDLITSGKLKTLIQSDGLRGMTSNPSIFQKAFAESTDYKDDIHQMTQAGKVLQDIYDTLTTRDVRDAADVFRPLYDATNTLDGYVSLEVSPHLAHDTDATLTEARKLWASLDRPNVLIKVPATKEGLPAIEQLISEGINVNVTLLFSVDRYREVGEAYIRGLEKRAAAGKPIEHIASVASFFLSRIDVLIDPKLEKIMAESGEKAALAKSLHGKTAIASAKKAYQVFEDLFKGNRFQALLEQGARVQRLLWASTSTKNPDYPDTLYVEALIGPETVNTVPVETFDAYQDHGKPADRLSEDMAKDIALLERLPELGIDLKAATQQLEDEGVQKFNDAFDQLTETLKKTMEE